MSVSLIDGHIDDDTMTDEQIIKALECCFVDDCDNCPCTFGNCEQNLLNGTIDLINRQKAEIESTNAYYKDEFERLRITYDRVYESKLKTAKADAIKEFAERLKEELAITDNNNWFEVTEHYLVWTIDNLVKEMVGEG